MAFPNLAGIAQSKMTSLFKKFAQGTYWQTKFGIFGNEDRSVQVLAQAAILDFNITEDREIAYHPIEANSYIADNVVKVPAVITLQLAIPVADYDQMFEELRGLITDVSFLFAIMYDGKFYPNMTLKSLPQTRTTEKYNLVQISLTFQEFIGAVAKATSMDDPANVELAQYANTQKKLNARATQVSTTKAAQILNETGTVQGPRI